MHNGDVNMECMAHTRAQININRVIIFTQVSSISARAAESLNEARLASLQGRRKIASVSVL